MKKALFIFLTILSVLPLVSHAQWTGTSPGSIYYNSGNVGIGTNNPILGNLQIDGVNDVLSLNGTGSTTLQFNAYNNVDFRIIQRSNGVMTLWTNTIERMRIASNGNVGIGTDNPTSKLSVHGGDVLLDNSTWYASKNTSGVSVPALGIGPDNQIYMGDLFGNLPGSNLIFRTNGNNAMTINSAGNIGIGTIGPDAKLAVNGTIHSKEVKVDMNVLPDYVFKPTYNLATLKEVKSYIDLNHHLPEVPSAQQIAKEGLNLGEMNATLLKKIEELTLYLIEKDKQVSDQNSKLADQQKEIEQLKQQQTKTTQQETRIAKLEKAIVKLIEASK